MQVFGEQADSECSHDRPEVVPFPTYAACRFLDTTLDNQVRLGRLRKPPATIQGFLDTVPDNKAQPRRPLKSPNLVQGWHMSAWAILGIRINVGSSTCPSPRPKVSTAPNAPAAWDLVPPLGTRITASAQPWRMIIEPARDCTA